MNAEKGASAITPTDISKALASNTPGQLRRRRAASRRMPVLGCGRRDPQLEKPKPRTVITVRVLQRGTLELKGAEYAVKKACKDVGARWMPAPTTKGAVLVRGDLGHDVEALLASRGYIVQQAAL